MGIYWASLDGGNGDLPSAASAGLWVIVIGLPCAPCIVSRISSRQNFF